MAGSVFLHVLEQDLLGTRAGTRKLRLEMSASTLSQQFEAFCAARSKSNLPRGAKTYLSLKNLIGSAGGQGTPSTSAKALQSRFLFQFGRHVLTECMVGQRDRTGQALLDAANNLFDWYGICARNGPQVSPEDCVQALALARNTCAICVDVWRPQGLPPKFHFWVCMSRRMRTFGNPRFFSLDVDETVNHMVGTICSKVHGRTWVQSTLSKYALLRAAKGRPW